MFTSRVMLLHSRVGVATCPRLLTDILGEDWTLVVPTFNWDFCQGKPYVHEITPSQVGLFSEYVRRQPGAVRSFHPIYSFAGVGPQAEELLRDVPRTSFGEGSVFDRLHKLDAWLCVYGVGAEVVTFVHHVEQMHNVPHRFHKYFTGSVTRDGVERIDTYEMFARYLDKRERLYDMTPVREFFDKQGVMTPGGVGLPASMVYEFVSDGLRQDVEFLLCSR